MAKSKTRTKREARAKLEAEAIRRGVVAKCGAKKAKGGKCGLNAGWGTTHEGIGRCRFHGGASPNGEMAAVKAKANAFATPIEVTPGQALAAVLHLSAGQLQWTTLEVGKLKEEEIVGEFGIHPMVRFQRTQMLDLAKLAKIAHEAGIDERLASLAEEQTRMFAKLVEALADDLNLSKEQRAKLGPAVRARLQLIQGTEEEAA